MKDCGHYTPRVAPMIQTGESKQGTYAVGSKEPINQNKLKGIRKKTEKCKLRLEVLYNEFLKQDNYGFAVKFNSHTVSIEILVFAILIRHRMNG